MTSGVACYVFIYSLFTVPYSLFTKSKKAHSFEWAYVGVTYFPGQSPGKYRRRK